MALSVERFSDDDLDSGARVYRTVFNEPPWNDEWTVETAWERLSEIIETPGYRGYGAWADEELIGLIMGNIEQWYLGPHFYVKEMCVRPSEQRRGIGTRLLDALLGELRSEEVERIYLLTMAEGPARAFYEAHGFRLNETMGMQVRELRSSLTRSE